MFKLDHWYIQGNVLVLVKKRVPHQNDSHYDYEVDVWGKDFSPSTTGFIANEKCYLFTEVPKEVADIIRGSYNG